MIRILGFDKILKIVEKCFNENNKSNIYRREWKAKLKVLEGKTIKTLIDMELKIRKNSSRNWRSLESLLCVLVDTLITKFCEKDFGTGCGQTEISW